MYHFVEVVPVVTSAVADDMSSVVELGAVVTVLALLIIAFMVALAGLFVTSGLANPFVVRFSL